MTATPVEAGLVGAVGLLLGAWLVVTAAERGTGAASERPRRLAVGLPAGWVLIVVSVVLMGLAVPTASETAPMPPRQTAPGVATTAPPHPPAARLPGG
jgi:hypothetical protein